MRRKDDFVPVGPTGKMVTWYACDPTVYEDAHLVHVKFVMNTTDIDDKIILQGCQKYLLARFKQQHTAEDDSVSDSLLAETEATFRRYIGTARSTVEALQALGKLPEFYAMTDDVLLPHLDALYVAEIDSDNHRIYLELSQKFERRFFEDMNALNILVPDQITRVTEYVPQIVAFVENE